MPEARSVVGVVGVVLAAGRGERLRPLTDVTPKPLLTVGGVPLLDIAIERLRPHVDRIAVNAHYLHEQIEAHLAGTDVFVSVEQPVALGTAGAVGQLREWIDGADVLVTNADVWYADPPAMPLPELPGTSRTTGARSARQFEMNMQLLVVRDALRGDFGDWRYAGTSFLPWSSVRDLEPVPSGLYEVRWREAYRRGRLDFMPYGGTYFDCGTRDDLRAANEAAHG